MQEIVFTVAILDVIIQPMKTKTFAILMWSLALVGCDPVSSSSTQPSTNNNYSGIVTEISVVPEDGSFVQIFVSFNDGRIVKTRCRYSTPFMIQKGSVNTFVVDSNLEISDVKIETPKQ